MTTTPAPRMIPPRKEATSNLADDDEAGVVDVGNGCVVAFMLATSATTYRHNHQSVNLVH